MSDEAIATIQREFPEAGIRITGRARTLRRQAELMAQRIGADRREFLNTYRPAVHITEMDQWVRDHSEETTAQRANTFEGIIRRALSRGARVSNHLADNAIDISWPIGDEQTLNRIEQRLNELGGHVIREANAPAGRHWHVDFIESLTGPALTRP
jgi:hypothetical protein